MDTHDKWVESSMDCIKGIENTTNQLSNKTYWVVIPRNEQDLKKNGDAGEIVYFNLQTIEVYSILILKSKL